MGLDYRTSTGLGEQTLGGHEQNTVCPRTLERRAATSQETEPDLPVSVQESLAEGWVHSGLHGVRGTEYNSFGISPFEGLTPTMVWPEGGNTAPLINRKLD